MSEDTREMGNAPQSMLIKGNLLNLTGKALLTGNDVKSVDPSNKMSANISMLRTGNGSMGPTKTMLDNNVTLSTNSAQTFDWIKMATYNSMLLGNYSDGDSGAITADLISQNMSVVSESDHSLVDFAKLVGGRNIPGLSLAITV